MRKARWGTAAAIALALTTMASACGSGPPPRRQASATVRTAPKAPTSTTTTSPGSTTTTTTTTTTPGSSLPVPSATPAPAPAATPTTTAVASPPTTRSCVAPVAAWSTQARVEQLVMAYGQFSSLGDSAGAASAGVGGLVLFGQPPAGSGPSITSGLAALAYDASSAGRPVPWFSTDEEGGNVARLAQVIGALPTPRQMAAQWSPAQVQAQISSHAQAMRSLGITMDLAPVVDTAAPTDTVADESDRSFSEDPSVASAYGKAYAAGLANGGVVAVAKHFPGMGHASADTDNQPATDPPLSQMENEDLVPFRAVAAAGVPVVMVGHPSVPGLTGGLPSSLSPAAYQLLRSDAGFRGVTVTDSLAAKAISGAGYSEASAAVAAVEAGADMVMVEASALPGVVDALANAVTGGSLSMATVEAADSAILALKGTTICG